MRVSTIGDSTVHSANAYSKIYSYMWSMERKDPKGHLTTHGEGENRTA
jgi:hypothetical protein